MLCEQLFKLSRFTPSCCRKGGGGGGGTGKRGRKVLFVLVTSSACFSPIPAIPALGVPPAEGGVTEPKSRGDEPASHPSGSPRNHRRIPLHYPPSAPPYPALAVCRLTPQPGCRQRVLWARPCCRAVPCQASLSLLVLCLGGGLRTLFFSYALRARLSHWSCGRKSSSPFPGPPAALT